MKISVPGLLPNTGYAVQVRSNEEGVVSKWSPVYKFTTIDDAILPKTPTNVTWTYDTQGFHASWSEVTQNTDNSNCKIDRYGVELTHNGVTKIVQVAPETGTVYYDLPLQRAQTIFSTQTIGTIQMRVRAVNASGNKSAWSSPLNASAGAPNPPTNAVVEELTDGLKISWTAPVNTTNLAGYHVYVSTSAGFPADATNRIYEGIAPTVTYNTGTYSMHYIKIRSYSAWGAESADLTAQGTPKSPFVLDSTAPSVPAITSVVVDRSQSIARALVTWTFDASGANADIAQFAVRYRKVGDTNWSMDFADKTARTLYVNLPWPYANYEFQIAAMDRVGNYSAFSATTTLNGDIPGAPSQVTGVTATTGVDSISLKWNATPEADTRMYKVEVNTTSNFTTPLISTTTGNTYITFSGLSPNTTYYFRVAAIDMSDNQGTWSTTGNASTTSFPVTPLSDGNPPSSSPAATAVGGIGYVFVSWPAITNADPVTYEVHISQSAGFGPTLGSTTKVAETPATNIILEKDSNGFALAYGTTYYVRIIAKDRDTTAGNAPAAGAVSAPVSPLKAVAGDITLSPSDIGAPTTGEMTNAINTSANGKNRITYSTAAPVNGTNTGILGDTWFVRDGTTLRIKEHWELTTEPSTWTKRILDGLIIANIDAGVITTGLLDAARVQVGATTTYSPGYNPITKATTFITTTASPTAPTAVAAGDIWLDQYNHRVYRATAAGTGSWVLATDAVQGVKNLWGFSSNNTLIDGGNIYTNTVRASALIVSDFNNYLSDPSFEDAGSWTLNSGSSLVAPSGTTPGYIIQNVDVVSSNRGIQDASQWAAVNGDEFFVSGEYYAEAANVGNTTFRPMLQMLDASGASLGFVGAINAVTLTNTAVWTAFEGVCTINQANTASIRWYSYVNSTTLNNKVRVRNIRIQRRANGKLIVDGSIQANKITAGTYTGGEFVIGTGGSLRTNASEVIITSNGITVTSAATGGISASALTTGTFGAGKALTVNGDMLINGNTTITNSGYISSTVYRPYGDPGGATGFRLSAAGLDIATGTIAANTIVGGTISSANIVLGTNGFLTVNTGGAIMSNNFNASTQTGWKIDNSGATFYGLNATISANNITGGTITANGNISVSNAGVIQSNTFTAPTSGGSWENGAGWSLGYNGFTMYGGKIWGPTVITNELYSATHDANSPLTAYRPDGTTVYNPSFGINSSGYAVFAGAYIYGNTQVGASASHFIQTIGFSPGTANGWKISGDGTAYFNNVTVKGTVQATSSTFSGTITGSSFTSTSSAGGTYAYVASGGIKIYNNGGSIALLSMDGDTAVYNGGVGNVYTGFQHYNGTDRIGMGLNAAGVPGIWASQPIKLWAVTMQGALNFNANGFSGAGASSMAGQLDMANNNITGINQLNGNGGSQISVAAGVIFNGTNNEFPSIPSVSGGVANVNFNSGTGFTNRIRVIPSSARKYKKNIHSLLGTLDADTVASLIPVSFQYKKSVSLDQRVVYGFIADDAAANEHLSNFVDYDDNGEVENFNYARFSAGQQIAIIDHHGRIKELEQENANLKSQLSDVLSRLEAAGI